MWRISGEIKGYPWGSTSAIPAFAGWEESGNPIAEVWYGAHALTSSRVLKNFPEGDTQGTESSLGTLREIIAADPHRVLGSDVVNRFGENLPYLLKLIAPATPLSLQVHPSKDRASQMFDLESDAGIPLEHPRRRYRDSNHKPELIYALSRFEAVAGFRAPRRAMEILAGIEAPLAQRVSRQLRSKPGSAGIRAAVSGLLSPHTRPSAEDVDQVVQACVQRLQDGISPSLRVDRVVANLGSAYPGDPGIIVAALMNPVTLHPGEVLFIPAGGIHAYLSGLGVELMANSDNVLRAGLTAKHVDVEELLACLDYVAAPPTRIAAERITDSTAVFYAPVDDFELSVSTLDGSVTRLPGRDSRICLCVEGEITLGHRPSAQDVVLKPAQAVFVSADEGPLYGQGTGILMQADVP
ncbi:MAG: mannose-6-phosphate isomerase, class I [Actinomycetaceae bacterium]|nr:mannose-6-phosphate isomerase, class I [Actinomycetaceae bacterium]